MRINKQAHMIYLMAESLYDSVTELCEASMENPNAYTTSMLGIIKEDSKGAIKRRITELRCQLNLLSKNLNEM